MCGILAIINRNRSISSGHLQDASAIIRHRGPDDEGFLTWQPDQPPKVWAGQDTASVTRQHWQYEQIGDFQPFKVAFGHRRLSIIDLSPLGHQPMLHPAAGLSISFNGEIYNYLEIKADLLQAGHEFNSASDTEVILHAWQEWGPACLHRFNGMFSFILLDHNKQELFAVRDRFGVKPLYYYNGTQGIYLASEIKQIKTSPDYSFDLHVPIARQFLAIGVTDHTASTFDTRIMQLPGGHYLHIKLDTEEMPLNIVKWYTLKPKKWEGSFDMAVGSFRQLLTDAVRLRLRSDVTVGSCLSGGLDSSSIVCLAADLLLQSGESAGQETVTACFENAKYDEWEYALEVINKTRAQPHRVFPSFAGLQEDMDRMLWHQDEPVGSTSVFSQWSVFKETNRAGLKVMIDGQGADEQLAGYGGNDLPLYAGLMGKGDIMGLLEEAQHYKKLKGAWPKGFLTGALQLNNGVVATLMPDRLKLKNNQVADWLPESEPLSIFPQSASSLQESLLRQLYGMPLPALLRYEDHNSMAWSVESRTPFMDYRLIEFNLGLPARFVYKNGVRKHILREAMKGILPDAVANRKDKMGFVTPEEVWLKGEGKTWFLDRIDRACNELGGHLLHTDNLKKYVYDMLAGQRPFDFVPWRVVCFHSWLSTVK